MFFTALWLLGGGVRYMRGLVGGGYVESGINRLFLHGVIIEPVLNSELVLSISKLSCGIAAIYPDIVSTSITAVSCAPEIWPSRDILFGPVSRDFEK